MEQKHTGSRLQLLRLFGMYKFPLESIAGGTTTSLSSSPSSSDDEEEDDDDIMVPPPQLWAATTSSLHCCPKAYDPKPQTPKP